MLIESLKTFYSRDLNKLKTEIESYPDEEALWKTAPGIANSGGNLCLHLIGNLNAYIGTELGHTGYNRNRELEFSLKDIPKAELIRQITATATMIEATLSQLTATQLEQNYPLKVFDYEMTTGHFLVHLIVHLDYHLGQINYHRRLLTAAV